MVIGLSCILSAAVKSVTECFSIECYSRIRYKMQKATKTEAGGSFLAELSSAALWRIGILRPIDINVFGSHPETLHHTDLRLY